MLREREEFMNRINNNKKKVEGRKKIIRIDWFAVEVVIEESMRGSMVSPRYAFVSLWKLITYFYPLLLSDSTSMKYLNNGDRWLTKTKIQNQASK